MDYFSLLKLTEEEIDNGNFQIIDDSPTLDNINDDIVEIENEIFDENPVDKNELLITAMQDASEELGLDFVCAKNDRHYILKGDSKLFDNDIVQNMLDEVIEVTGIDNEPPTSTAKKVIQSYADMQEIDLTNDEAEPEVTVEMEIPGEEIDVDFKLFGDICKDLSNVIFDNMEGDLMFEVADNGSIICDISHIDNKESVKELIKNYFEENNYNANISLDDGNITIDSIENIDNESVNKLEIPIYSTVNENLNQFDKLTGNKYDLLNTFLSSDLSASSKKHIAEMIVNRKSPKDIYEYMCNR